MKHRGLLQSMPGQCTNCFGRPRSKEIGRGEAPSPRRILAHETDLCLLALLDGDRICVCPRANAALGILEPTGRKQNPAGSEPDCIRNDSPQHKVPCDEHVIENSAKAPRSKPGTTQQTP